MENIDWEDEVNFISLSAIARKMIDSRVAGSTITEVMFELEKSIQDNKGELFEICAILTQEAYKYKAILGFTEKLVEAIKKAEGAAETYISKLEECCALHNEFMETSKRVMTGQKILEERLNYAIWIKDKQISILEGILAKHGIRTRAKKFELSSILRGEVKLKCNQPMS